MLCVKFHPVFFQKQHLFILKGGCPVMLDLIGNIFLHRRAVGNAHREGAATGLPGRSFSTTSQKLAWETGHLRRET
jgi:hypothetical protein